MVGMAASEFIGARARAAAKLGRASSYGGVGRGRGAELCAHSGANEDGGGEHGQQGEDGGGAEAGGGGLVKVAVEAQERVVRAQGKAERKHGDGALRGVSGGERAGTNGGTEGVRTAAVVAKQHRD
ncbi:unnamed protein product [Chondrus crispus]|uniref:Uncharacterized protein n=1 Tax=Chondrus crispus TaxID=2769 RepID=R7QQN9_CHOCR|nr:unnamed protein product [Chondrus crispus]CDF40439.1 unnamed protein product [Chondrus crispus]|eukprot:XP_005710733.1 unnamed protein product [Chondrus crispus]